MCLGEIKRDKGYTTIKTRQSICFKFCFSRHDFISDCYDITIFLWQSITTEKQITELQTTGQRLAKIVDSQAFAEGDAKSFAEFAQLVKSFNQQWDDFKQLQNNYPIEKIKEIDGMKNTLNTQAPKWLALQKEIFFSNTG